MRTRSFNVLVSSAGRRVALLNCVREALLDLGLPGRVIAADASPYSSAGHVADAFLRVPPCTHEEFVPAMLDLCNRHKVSLIVPTIDTELPVFAERRGDFEAAGVAVAISSPAVVAVACDKRCTHQWLTSHGFPTVRQTTPEAVLAAPDEWHFPLIVKPAIGSSAKGICIARDVRDISRHGSGAHVVQTIAAGREYTVDVLMNRRGVCLCAVPRWRLEVRSGEVSKAVTVREQGLERLAQRIAEELPGAYGALNIQIMLDPATGSMQVIELNARFGGGFPLTSRAGGKYTRWMIEEILGLPSTADATTWKAGLLMLRYDEGVFVDTEARTY